MALKNAKATDDDILTLKEQSEEAAGEKEGLETEGVEVDVSGPMPPLEKPAEVTENDDERNMVKNLRQKALFLLEAERQFFVQKLKIKHLLETDKGSKYFHSLIKRKAGVNSLTSLVVGNGHTTTSFKQMGEEFVFFFKNLFGETRDRVGLDSDVIRRGKLVSNTHSAFLIAGISKQEIKEALFDIKDDKAPGPDGFSAAFFKAN